MFEQPGDSVTLHPPRASLIHTEVTLLPEDIFIPVAPMLQVITELLSFRRLQLRARQPRPQIVPNLHRLLHN